MRKHGLRKIALINRGLMLSVWLVLAGTALAGNWAIVTLSNVPDYAVAGKPVPLAFAVRQHGKTLLAGLHPSIRATAASGQSAKFDAVPGSSPEEYKAIVTLPRGDWTITIVSGFNNSTLTLPALKVIEAASAAPAPFSPITRGVRLFTGKGCIGCHRHIEVNPDQATEAKMDLSGRRFPQGYLRKFLGDPSIKTADMPNLNLDKDEIEALAAFINKLATKTRGEEQR
jgi:hypothetical protein